MDLNFEDVAPERGDWCRKAAWIADRGSKCGYVVVKWPGFQADILKVRHTLLQVSSLSASAHAMESERQHCRPCRFEFRKGVMHNAGRAHRLQQLVCLGY